MDQWKCYCDADLFFLKCTQVFPTVDIRWCINDFTDASQMPPKYVRTKCLCASDSIKSSNSFISQLVLTKLAELSQYMTTVFPRLKKRLWRLTIKTSVLRSLFNSKCIHFCPHSHVYCFINFFFISISLMFY